MSQSAGAVRVCVRTSVSWSVSPSRFREMWLFRQFWALLPLLVRTVSPFLGGLVRPSSIFGCVLARGRLLVRRPSVRQSVGPSVGLSVGR